MATKISINHALEIMKSNTHHKLIDVYVTLSKISCQHYDGLLGEERFVIYSDTNSIYNLSQIIKKESPYMKCRTTISSCIDTLIEMKIIQYDYLNKYWIMLDMEEMLNKGYIELRTIFFTKTFYDLNITEKKALFYSIYLMSTKGFKKMKQIKINLKKEDSEWFTIFKSKNIYYIKGRIQNIIDVYFEDNLKLKKEFVKKGELKLKEGVVKENSVYIDKCHSLNERRKLAFSFCFYPKYKNPINDKISSLKSGDLLQQFRTSDSGFYGFLTKLKERQNSIIKRKFTDGIMIALLRYCNSLSYRCKQEIAMRVLTKLHDSNDIVSPSRYINAIVKAYLEEI